MLLSMSEKFPYRLYKYFVSDLGNPMEGCKFVPFLYANKFNKQIEDDRL